MNKKTVIIILGSILLFSLIMVSYNQRVAFAKKTDLEIEIHHGGSGTVQTCLKNKGYSDLCNTYDLERYRNPFILPIGVQNPRKGDNFKVCYKVEGQGSEGCKEFEFNGDNPQTISITIPDTGTGTLSNSNNKAGSTGSFSNGQDQQQPQLPPPQPPTPPQQSTTTSFMEDILKWFVYSSISI